MKSKLVIGNWKMNKDFEAAEELTTAIQEAIENINLKTEVVLCPPFPYLELVTDMADESNFNAGAQNCSQFNDGAYTGEVSASMLAGMGVTFCIVGHSERRKYFHETSEVIAEKVNRLIEQEIIPVVCCGEVLEERQAGRHFEVVEAQIKEALFHLPKEKFEHVVIAYEPVWAIGTGKTATAAQAEEIHACIRKVVADKFGAQVADDMTILYGGSCKPSNAKELFAEKDIDGGLIGGAALKAEDFIGIATSFE